MAAMARGGQEDSAGSFVVRAYSCVMSAVGRLLTNFFLMPASEAVVGSPAHDGEAR